MAGKRRQLRAEELLLRQVGREKRLARGKRVQQLRWKHLRMRWIWGPYEARQQLWVPWQSRRLYHVPHCARIARVLRVWVHAVMLISGLFAADEAEC